MPEPARRRTVRTALLIAALGWLSPAPLLAEATVVIRGRGAEIVEAPVVVPFEARIAPGDYHLEPEGGGSPLRGNVFLDGDSRFLAAWIDRLGADESRTFRLVAAPAADNPQAIGVEPSGDDLTIRVGGGPFTTLRLGERKPYLFPVIGPTGAPFTRAYPMEAVEGEAKDHPHQRSFWFTHGEVNGVDFWASDPENRPNPKFGTIRQTDRPTAVGGLAAGRVRTRNDWLGPDGSKLCEDQRVFTFWAAEGRRYIDVDVTVLASQGAVLLGDTKEGTFGLRVASTMDANRPDGGRIVNAQGETNARAWGKPSPWVDYSGPVDGRTVGVAILNHPESFRYPTTWHVRDYGLFAANPFGYKDFGIPADGRHELQPGQSIQFFYRVVLHEDDAEAADIAASFRAYAEAPAVTVTAD